MTAAGEPDVAEGDFPWKIAVIYEWPSRKDALEFLHSDEYNEIKKQRKGAADFQTIIIEGVHLAGPT
jgi:uncharacterized protein (DUF1330 family)